MGVGCVKMLFMMHECPKCHFVQPKDRYCANCGLDIESYVPAPEPALKKFSKNTSLHVSIVVILTLLAAMAIYVREKDKIMEHFRNAPLLMSSKNSDRGDTPERPRDENGELQAGQPSEAITAPAPNPSATATALENSAQARRELTITFAEASVAFIQQLESEGQLLNETAQRRSYLINGPLVINKLKERDPDFRILRGGQNFNLKVGSPMSFDFTHLSGTQNEDVGLTLDMNPESVTEDLVELSLMGSLNLKDEAGNSNTSQEISANFSFSPKSTLVMVGFLPHQQIKPDDKPLFINTPLAVYDSPQFITGITDFVIFIQVK